MGGIAKYLVEVTDSVTVCELYIPPQKEKKKNGVNFS